MTTPEADPGPATGRSPQGGTPATGRGGPRGGDPARTGTGAVDVLAADGGIVRIRPTAATDADDLHALYERASPDNLYRRFFAVGKHLAHEDVARVVRPPDADHVSLLAEAGGQIVGIGSYERLAGASAEFAIFVDDAQHGRGIGTLLLEHLVAAARRNGVSELVGDVLTTNAPMLRVAGDLGPRLTTEREGEVSYVRIPTHLDDAATDALDERDRRAERRSITPLLAPRAVAVVGAGRTPGGIGHEVLRSLLDNGYTGPIYPVNRHARTVAGLTAYHRLAEVPGPVDLAVIAVPAAGVADTIRDAAAAGVRAVVVLTAGFGEAGEDGRAGQAELVRIARSAGIRLVGPNCLGVLNTDPAVALHATFAHGNPPPGGLAVASQSGAVGIAVLDHAVRSGTGISSFVSLGNKADVSGNDLLAYWYDDPATRAVALYLESVGNPRRFARVARALARRKPVLAVKSGRSASGLRAGASHTAAAAAPDATVDTLFTQAGVVRCDTLSDLLDTARLITGTTLPAGNRLGLVGNAGGANVLAADAAEAAGLVIAPLSAGTARALAAAAPGATGYVNPVDLGAAATPTALGGATAVLADSGEVDALVVIFAGTRANDIPRSLEEIGRALDDHPDLPAAVVLLGIDDRPATLGARRVPVYGLPEPPVTALGRAAGYTAWRRQPLGAEPVLPDVDTGTAREVVAGALARGGGWQPPEVAARLLRAYRIPIVSQRIVRDADEAVAAAEALGYPVALKAADPGLVHKSDIGGVRLGLGAPAAVRAGYAAVATALGADRPPVLVQPMVTGSVELVAGVVHDPTFGSVVMLGLGGVHTELFGDRALHLLPLTDLDAGRMWRSLRAAPLLTGYRGAAKVDCHAVESLLLRLGRLAEDLPEVAELDLNPVMAGPDGVIAVDVKLRLAAVGAEPDPGLRVLRTPG